MRHVRVRGGIILAAACVAACQPAAVRQAAPPRACGLAEFGAAQGVTLPGTAAAARQRGKKPAAPLKIADGIPLNRSAGTVNPWVDAAPGWKAWRVWLRSEEARSVSVHLQPFSLPPGAELWICSPDGTARHGPYRAQGPGAAGQLFSAAVAGPELWLEVLAPDDAVGQVEVTLATAFAAFR